MKGQTTWEYAHKLQEQLGRSGSDIAAEICDVLAVNLLGGLPADYRSILAQYPVVVLPTRDPNAMCIAAPGGGAVIAIDYGLLSFLNVLNKIVLSRYHGFGMEPTISIGEASRMARNALDYFFEHSKDLPRWPVAPKRMLIASALSNVQLAFVVGHELAHAMLGHLEDTAGPPVIESSTVAAPVLSFANAHEQEFAADLESARMTISHFSKIYDPLFGSNEPSYSQAGVDIFFAYLELLDSVFGVSYESATHPPSKLRRRKLREAMWKKLPETSRTLAESFDDIVASLAAEIRDAEGKGA